MVLDILFSEDSPLYILGHLLAGIGAVNWLLIGGFDYNLVTSLLGQGSTLTQAVYILAGLGGVQVLGDVLMDYGMME